MKSGNIGGIHNLVSCNDYDAFFSGIGGIIAPAGFSAGANAFTAGVQLGFDWQWCNKVLGVVGDWNWADLKRDFPFASNVAGLGLANNNKNDWFATIRGRTGFTVCDALVYVTLGGATIRHKSEWLRSGNDRRATDTCWGWVAGVGLEYKVWCNWSIGAEVLSLFFKERQRHITGPVTESTTGATTSFRLGFTDSVWVGRILLNYRFGDLLSCCCR